MLTRGASNFIMKFGICTRPLNEEFSKKPISKPKSGAMPVVKTLITKFFV